MNYRSKIFLLTGLYALLAIFIAKRLFFNYYDNSEGLYELTSKQFELVIFSLAIVTFIMTLITIAIIVKRNTHPITFKKRFHFLIPSLLGWTIIFLLLQQNKTQLIVPTSLIIFGLILLNLNRFVTSRLVYFGISLIVLGIITFIIPSQNWLFLILGFGVFPILFGLILLKKSNTPLEA